MKRIVYFEIVDMGIRNGMGTPRDVMLKAIEDQTLFNGYTTGGRDGRRECLG